MHTLTAKSDTKSTVNQKWVLVMLKMLVCFAISSTAFGERFSLMYILWQFFFVCLFVFPPPSKKLYTHNSGSKGIKTRRKSFPVWVKHTHRRLQTHKRRHYLGAMDHVNGILSTLWECGRCFSAWLGRLSTGTVCTTDSIYFIFRDEGGRLLRVDISVCLPVYLCASG